VFADALRGGAPVVLDGGLSTWLAAQGHDLSDHLWSARLIDDEPEAIVDAHLAFIRAGASVVTTASYQATEFGFARRGVDAQGFRDTLKRSVALAREACEWAADTGVTRPLYVAASVGPYGAMLADGSEYKGDYGLSVRQLLRFHHDRLRVLADAGPDVLALETVPDAVEAEALLEALAGVGVPAWLSYTVKGDRTRAGQPLRAAFELAAQGEGMVAVGVNCCDPRDVPGAVAAAAATGLPAVAYPNSGEDWDAQTGGWTGRKHPVADWAGARLIGGCCRVTPDDIAGLGAPTLG
jgi:S-methylmethionine-dependent homocysteine/selenocysteine methylase